MKEKIEQYFSTKWPAIIWSVIVFLLLVIPPVTFHSEKKIGFSHMDKVIHFFLFGIIAGLWAYHKKQQQASNPIYIRIVFFVLLYGIITEFVQEWVGRDFDVWDMVADGAGALVFVYCIGYKKEDPGRNRGRNQN